MKQRTVKPKRWKFCITCRLEYAAGWTACPTCYEGTAEYRERDPIRPTRRGGEGGS